MRILPGVLISGKVPPECDSDPEAFLAGRRGLLPDRTESPDGARNRAGSRG
ncbi:MAG: hypothetical protein JWP75_1570 [Frondihabitans sp.]|nr:hypothetical protein [Frondihabitans sp.]